ncbi:MAG TPA: class I SAM-dependent methyltransferase [Thermoanaerobaculia bacterium]|jgi:ubiquinone/menaquinone biosynthesis C-methylase UbiE|nr:class I SAM-dependent methyltransferase [Thermoanaerobaculia bacterium]
MTDRDAIRTVPAVCPLCRSEPLEPHARGRDFEYGTTGETEWTVRCCGGCGILALSPRPSDEELARIYPESYYAYDFTSRRSIGYRVKELWDRRSVRAYRQYTAGNVLDIGCGDGRLLKIFRRLGVSPDRLHGVELNDEAVRAARAHGFRVERKRFEQTAYPSEFFHLVVLQQVIEHVPDPGGMIGELARILAPGGAAVVETPNTASWDHALFRRRYWGGYHIPRHFFLFQKRTLRALLERSGFDVVRVQSLPSPMFWIHSFHHAMAEKGFPSFLRRLFEPYPPNPLPLALFTAADTFGRVLGITSNMRLVAVKR